jgi:predicted RNase H-like HicB family nuclease
MKFYDNNVFCSTVDAGYGADNPDLEYCLALGATAEETVCEVGIARAAWLKAGKYHGKRLTEPNYRPAISQLTR